MELTLSSLTPVSRAVWAHFVARAEQRVDQLAIKDDIVYRRTLRALGRVPEADAKLLVDVLFSWRDSKIGSRRNALRKPELAVESVFLEAAINLTATATLPKPQRLIDVALQWTLYHHQFVARTAGDADTERLREGVLELSARLLGLMSHSHIAVVERAFLDALQTRLGKAGDAAERQQIQQLCQGMRWVRLQCDTAEQLGSSTQFLVDVQPLEHKAVARKSLVQHWICQMLTEILGAYTAKHAPRRTRYPFDSPAGDRWFREVNRLITDISRWIRSHSKHVTEGFPFLTQLVCVADDLTFAEQADDARGALMDNILKLMKDKSTRGLALECHVQIVHSYLLRFAPLAGVVPDPTTVVAATRGPSQEQTIAWVDRVVQPVILSMRKGLWGANEQHDLVRRLTLLVGHHLPEYAVDSMVGQLLAADASWECMLVGAQVLRNILDTAPDRRPPAEPARTSPGPQPHSGSASEPRRVGGSPFARYGIRQLEWKVAAMLKAAMQLCHQTAGHHVSIGRSVSEYRERPPALAVLAALLRCVPYVLPEHWRGVHRTRMADELWLYTIHVDKELRDVSARVLRACVRCYPDFREVLLVGGLRLLSRIPDENEQELYYSTQLLETLINEWLVILEDQLENGALGYFDAAATPGTLRFDVHHLEGLALVLLSHGSSHVRRSAWQLLVSARRLHRTIVDVIESEQPNTPAALSDLSATGADVAALMSQRLGTSHEEAHITYLMDVLEQSGQDLVQQCYWDFGPWSNIWSRYRAQDDVDDSFKALILFRPHPPDGVKRTARLLGELAKKATLLCRPTCQWAYNEAINRLLRLREDRSADSTDDKILIPESVADWRRDLYLLYCCVAGAAAHGFLKEAHLPPITLVKALAVCLRSGVDWHMDLSTLALGHLHPAQYGALVQELQEPTREYTSLHTSRAASRGRVRKEDLRLAVATVWRQVSGSMPPGRLKSNTALRNELLRFVRHPMVFEVLLKDTQQRDELTIDQLRLRFCLCCVVQCCGTQLGASPAASSVFDIDLRSKLFDLIALWCKEGFMVLNPARPEDMFVNLARERIAATKRVLSKDAEAAKALERELMEALDTVEHAAHQALAALLQGPAFDARSRTKLGRPLSWVDRMFRAHSSGAMGSAASKLGPSKPAVALRALTQMLETNPDMAHVVLDQCYAESQSVAVGYFQVLVEVFSLQGLALPVHQLLALALFNLVHDRQDVRADALQLLNELAVRAWLQDSGSADITAQEGAVAVVLGRVPDSYQQFQFHLSAKLAREHPKLSESLVVELLNRMQGQKQLRHGVLACLAPWAENLIIPAAGWKGNWCGDMLHALYHVMIPPSRGPQAQMEIERLWNTLAVNKNNVLAMVDFLVAMGLEETSVAKGNTRQYFDVAKRAILYLARISSQQTIDSLVCELRGLQQQAVEEGAPLQPLLRDSMDGMLGSATNGRPIEFQQPAYPGKGSVRGPFNGTTSVNASMDESTRGSDSMRSSGGYLRITSSNFRPGASMSQFATELAAPIRRVANDFFKVTGIAARSDSGSERDSRISASVVSFGGMDGAAVLNSDAEFNPVLSRVNSGEHKGRSRDSLTRPELALCLLADAAYEQDEDLRMYLPLLVHVAVVLADSRSAMLVQHCQHLLVNLLNSLSARHLEVHHKAGTMLSEYKMVSGLITYLESMSGRRLWAYEDASWSTPLVPSCRALETLVDEVVGSVFFERDLSSRWAETALEWMVSSHCQHLASRSHQVYRALKPPLTQQGVGHLLNGLHKALSSNLDRPQPVALEMLLTLQALVESSAAQQLLMYPQLLLSCLPLLQLSYVQLFATTLELFSKVLTCVDLNSMVVQNVLLVSCPGSNSSGDDFTRQLARGSAAYAESGWWVVGMELFGHPPEGYPPGTRLCAVQQLLIKGLYRPDTEALTVVALLQLMQHVARLPTADGFMDGQTAPCKGPAFLSQLSLVIGHAGFGEAAGVGAGLGAVLGDPELQVVITLWSLLPWLCVRRSDKERMFKMAVKVLRAAATAVGFEDVAESMLHFHNADASQLHSATSNLCEALAVVTFPRYARFALQRLLEQLQQGAPEYRDPIFVILAALLERPRVDVGDALGGVKGEPFLLEPVAQLMKLEEGNALGPKALAVIEAALNYTSRRMTGQTPGNSRGSATPMRSLRDGDDRPPSNTSPVLTDWPEAVIKDTKAANKAAVGVLGRLLSTGASSGARSRKDDSYAHFMPFMR